MRILVLQLSARDERPRLDQRVDDRLVGVADFAFVGDDALALEARRFIGEGAVLVDRIGNARIDPTLLKQSRARGPELEVLAPVAGRGVNEACSCVFRHMVAVEQRNGKAISEAAQWVGADRRRQRIACDLAKELERANFRGAKNALGKRLREDIGRSGPRPIVCRRIRHPVAPIGDPAGEGDRSVAGNGPRRRGPDEHRSVIGCDRERNDRSCR